MEIKRYEDMDLQALDVMREIGSIGTSHAATALSKLLQKEVRISIPSVNILGYNDAMNRIGDAEELVAAALVKMSGDIEGLMLFLFDLDFANEVLEKLLGSRYKSFLDMDEMARSALVEVGNIIICSYINAFSQLVNVEVELSVPSATINMLGGILMVPIAEYGYETDKLMYCNADFVIGGKALSDWLLMLPDIRSLNDSFIMIGATELKVGIGDMKFSRGEGRIITYALGSCIGITFYDPVTRLGALLHIMLPAQFEGKDSNPFKFADSGIRETLRKLKIFGMVKSRMVVKIAGGAKMFEISGNSSFGNIGQRNAESVKKVMAQEGICIAAEDTGGNYARTMLLDLATGDVIVRTVGRPERHL